MQKCGHVDSNVALSPTVYTPGRDLSDVCKGKGLPFPSPNDLL